MILLFSHVRTGRWASVMPARLAETLGLTEMIRAIPIIGAEPYPTIGLVVPHRDPMTPLTAALVAEARRLARRCSTPSTINRNSLSTDGTALLIASACHSHAVLPRNVELDWDRCGAMTGMGPRARRAKSSPRMQELEGAALPILHALQEEFGYIDREAVPLVPHALNLSRAEVHGVVSFYHDFREEPAGRHVLKLCRAEACQSMGADALAAEARERLQLGWHETTPDGRVTLGAGILPGLCACAPAAMLDGKVVGALDRARLAALIARWRRMSRAADLHAAGCRRAGARRRRGRAAIIAAERRRGIEFEIVRTGSRGLFWLEPMIEVATGGGRIAYGPVSAGGC